VSAEFCLENLKGGDDSEDVAVNGRIILNGKEKGWRI
jgi:hypothetical protein